LGRWDGKISLWKSGWTQINLIDEVILGILEDADYVLEIDDRRKFPNISNMPLLTEQEEFVGPEKTVNMRDYQCEAGNTLLTNNAGIVTVATGGGKSYICGAVSQRYSNYGTTMVIVPTTGLVLQTARNFRNMGLNDVGEVGDGEKNVGQITVSTWHSLAIYPEILMECVALIVDECHGSKARVLMELLNGAGANVPFRYGCTGTLPDFPLEAAQVTASLGQVLYDIPAHVLQDKGILAKCMINIVQTTENKKFDDYDVERKFLTTDHNRMKWVADYCRDLMNDGNTLVLVNNIDTGTMLSEMIGHNSIFYSSKNSKAKDRMKKFEEMNAGDNGIIVSTPKLVGTGIDIPRIFHVVLFELGKAGITIIQVIGRGLRIAPDKDYVNLHDLCADTKYSKKHLTERKKHYDKNKYPYNIQKVRY
jgi:superfamily II DNA or RNA helicase